MKIGRLLLRLTVGGFFFGHGTQKLFGWFGGNGLDATAAGFETLGLRPGRRNAIAAGVAEAGGGALLASGLASPVAASVLTATMLTAIDTVHLKNGPWAGNGGYEYNVVLIAAVIALVETDRERSNPAAAAAALAVGTLGAFGARKAAEAQPPAPAPAPAPGEDGQPADPEQTPESA
jgi:putative oxidoreductase